MHCQVCGGSDLTQFLSLGDQPPSDAFLKKEDLEKPEATYPLDLLFCASCSLVQLGYIVDPDLLFRDYVYTTGSNNALRANFKDLVENAVKTYKLGVGDFVVDIGSNDGTLLENYLAHGVTVLGIDPSSAAELAQKKGIPTVQDYFNVENAQKVVQKNGRARVITATNVFAHVSALDSFMQGVVALLDERGVFISESSYIVDMVEGVQYDSIYHEHLRYYSVRSLVTLFERYGMEIARIEHIQSHGGSLRVFAAKKGAFSISPEIEQLAKDEEKKGFYELGTYQAFAERVENIKRELITIVGEFKKKGAHIVGIGAPAKGNTLLNFCGLDTDFIDYLTEKSELKVGLFAPGTHIPVVAESRMLEEQPEAALLLSWNLADELIPKLKHLGYQGRFIIPNPTPRVV